MKLFLGIFAALLMVGCFEPGPDPKAEQDRTQRAIQVRKLFDSVSGNYESLSADQKKELLDLFDGNEQNARQTWGLMQTRGQGAPSGAGPAAGMPGGGASGQ